MNNVNDIHNPVMLYNNNDDSITIPSAFLRDACRLNKRGMRVLLYLLSRRRMYKKDPEFKYIKNKKLSEETSLDPSAVRVGLTELSDANLIKFGLTGKGLQVGYKFTLPCDTDDNNALDKLD